MLKHLISGEGKLLGSLPFDVQAFDHLTDAVIIVDNASIVLYLNEATKKLYDLNMSVLGKKITEIFIEETPHYQESYGFLEKGTYSIETHHKKKNGLKIRVHQSLSPYYDSIGKKTGKTFIIHPIPEKEETKDTCNTDSFFNIDQDFGYQELSNIIDSKALQAMMDDLYSVTKIGCAVLDLKGNILASAGWQDICSKFHRVNPQSLWNCLESDLILTRGVARGEFRAYKCKNNMWDIVTPLIIGKKHVGNIFSGQFFFNDEVIDRETFSKQAEKFGFDKAEYLKALDRVPKWDRTMIESLMRFYVELSEMISKLSYSNLKLVKTLSEQKTTENELRKSQHDLSHAQAVAKTGSWRLNIQKNELVWSDETYRLFAVPKGTPLTYQNFLEFIHPEDKQYVDEKWHAALQGEPYDVEHRIVVNNDVLWVHEKAELEFDKDGTLISGFGTVQDITEHKMDQERLRKLNRAMRAISNSNQILMRASDETAFLQQGCRIIVEDCGYSLVWIGFTQYDDKKSVKPMAYAGFDKGYIDSLKITWEDTLRGQGPTGKAIRTGKFQICNDVVSDEKVEPWRKEALKRGYLSFIVLPLIAENSVFGVINIYSKEKNTFSDDEVNLLSELANDFSHGISILRMRAMNELTNHALLYNKERLGLLSSTASSLLSSAEPQIIIKEICEKVMTFLKCDVFFNYLVDDQKECLHLNAYAGIPTETAKKLEWLQLREIANGYASQQGQLIACENISDINDPRNTLVNSFGIKAYATNALFSDGKVIGTLSFGSKQKQTFTPDDLSLMSMITSQVSVAMQRKQDEELVKTTLNRFYDSLTSMHGNVLLLSPKDSVEFVNPSFCESFQLKDSQLALKGLSFDEVLEKIKNVFLFPDQEVRRMKELILKGHPVMGEEIALKGNKVALRDYIPLQRDGKSLGSLWHYMDITPQKKAEETLLRAEHEWERTFDSLPDLIAIVDQKHRLLRVNKPMADKLGLKPEQCFGLQCFICVHKTNEAPDFCPHTKTLADGKKHTIKIYDKQLGGNFLVSTSPLPDENGNIIASIHTIREISSENNCEKIEPKKKKK